MEREGVSLEQQDGRNHREWRIVVVVVRLMMRQGEHCLLKVVMVAVKNSGGQGLEGQRVCWQHG